MAEVRRGNGYLHLDQFRLDDEHKPGLFFIARGEAVDLRSDPARWRNIPLYRAAKSSDPSEAAQDDPAAGRTGR